MKKVFLSFATIAFVATGALTVTSCGGDDDAPVPGNVDPVPTGIKLVLTTDPSEIFAGEPFELTINKADGTPITGAVLNVNGEPTQITSTDGVFSIQGPAGEITLTATFEGTTSNEVLVNVQPSEIIPSEGTGTFTYGGTVYDIENTYVVFRGLFYTDDTQTTVIASWQIEAVSGNHTAIARFNTPTQPASGGQYEYELPSQNNTTGIVTGVFVGETLGGQSNTNVVINFNAPLNQETFEGTYSATSDVINGSPFSLNFEGTSPLVESAERPAAKGKGVINYVEVGKVMKAESVKTLVK